MNILSFIKQNLSLVFFAIAVILGILYFNGCQNNKILKNQIAISTQLNAQNDSALLKKQDTIRLKNGESETLKDSYVSTLKNLKSLNDSLYNEILIEKGTVNALIKEKTVVTIDSLKTNNSVIRYNQTLYGLKFNIVKLDSALTFRLNGVSHFSLIKDSITPGETILDSVKIGINVIVGFETLDDVYRVFVRSASPFVSFNNVSGALIIPKSPGILCPPAKIAPRFGLGPEIGYGFSVKNSLVSTSIYLGVGLHYDLVRF